MAFWRDCTPPGMELKSEGPSSDLFDPRRELPIETYYKGLSRPFDVRTVIPADVFIAYGLEFQKTFAPDVDPRQVTKVSRAGDKFQLTLEDGATMRAGRVVIATGIRDYAYIPEALRAAPSEFVSHSCEYGPVDRFAGRKVIVIGGGASAVDLAWSLYERGSDVSLVCRAPKIDFHPKPPPRTWRSPIRSPHTPIGGGWKLLFYARLPNLFRLLPEATRRRIVATTLGPFPGWFMTERVPGRIPILGGLQITGAQAVGDKISLTAKGLDGQTTTLTADHVVAATGYRVDLDRLPFLDQGLRKGVRTAGGAPVLSADFESSERGLYFIGAVSAPTFGPVMRFVAGAGFAVRRVSRRLASTRARTEGRSSTSEYQAVKWGGKSSG